MGDYSKAEQDFNTAIGMDEEYLPAHYSKALTLCEQNRYDEGIYEFDFVGWKTFILNPWKFWHEYKKVFRQAYMFCKV